MLLQKVIIIKDFEKFWTSCGKFVPSLLRLSTFKMAGIEALVSAYGKDSDSEENESPEEEITEDHTAHLNPGSSIHSMKSKFQLNVAPTVVNKVSTSVVVRRFAVLWSFFSLQKG